MGHTFNLDLVRNSQSKSYLFVKLTDSALTAIEEYSKSLCNGQRKSSNDRPSAIVQFHSNRGVISFPSDSSSIKDKRYSFSMSGLDGDGSIECIRQSGKGWKSLGPLACKLQIHAEEDIYQKTKSKVEAAEQESRKYCTKVLEVTGNSQMHGGKSGNRSRSLANQKTRLDPIGSSNGSQAKKAKTSHHAPLMQKSMQLMSIRNSTPSASSNATTNAIATTNTSNNTSSSSSNNVNNQNNNHTKTNANSHIKNSIKDSISTPITTKKANVNNNISKNNSGNNSSTGNNVHDPLKPANSHKSWDSSNLAELYLDIKNVAQLRKYKAEFDRDFVEYQRLHQYLHDIERKFYNLESSLKTKVDGSEEWEATRDEIFREYDKIKSDNDFHRARRNYTHLHDKLAHIKNKIFQYKQARRNAKRK